jgi:hypothetical protein
MNSVYQRSPSLHARPILLCLTVIESIPTQRTAGRVARLEPLVQAHGVECILAGAAPLVGQLPVGADDGVADGALGLAFEGTNHVALVSDETVNQGAVLRTNTFQSVLVE